MATYSRGYFSTSTNGLPIAVTSTNSTGATAFHTTSTNTEEIYLDAYNNTNVAVDLYVNFGSTINPVVTTIPAKAGPLRVIDGWPLRNGKIVKAYCSTVSTSALFVVGRTAVINSTAHV